jgi:hypothetical protein
MRRLNNRYGDMPWLGVCVCVCVCALDVQVYDDNMICEPSLLLICRRSSSWLSSSSS